MCIGTHGKRDTESYCTDELILKFSFYIAIHPSLLCGMSEEQEHVGDYRLEEAGSLAK